MDEHTYVPTNEWIREQVPYEWEHVICTCPAPTYGLTSDICTKCNKHGRWQLHNKCLGCGQKYYGYYLHHASPPVGDNKWARSGWYRCFDCMVKKHGTNDEDVPPAIKPRVLRTLDEIFDDNDDDLDDFTL